MSTIDRDSPPGRATDLRRAVAADRIRLGSVRSTWWSLLGAAAMMGLLGFGVGTDSVGATPIWVAGEIGIAFVQFVLLLPATLLVTAEQATGAIHPALMAVPRRGVLGPARLLVAVVTTTVAGVVLALFADVVSWVLLGSDAVVDAGDVASSLGSVAALMATGTVVVVGLGLVLRSTAGTVTSAFLSLLVLPALLPEFGVTWLRVIGENLPGAATMAMLEVFGDQRLGPGEAAVLAAVWVIVTTTAGFVSLVRRDAS